MSVDVARTGLHLLAPPTRLGWADELPLGAPVVWTHRAAVIRWTQKDGRGFWRLTEGRAHDHEEPPMWRATYPDEPEEFAVGVYAGIRWATPRLSARSFRRGYGAAVIHARLSRRARR